VIKSVVSGSMMSKKIDEQDDQDHQKNESDDFK